MSSGIRSMIKRMKSQRRAGFNTRGNKPGPAQSERQRPGGVGLQFLTKEHDLKAADKKCRMCHGTGVVKSTYVKDGKARELVCSCVSS